MFYSILGAAFLTLGLVLIVWKIYDMIIKEFISISKKEEEEHENN
jgi:hypothetical protein